MNGNNLPGIPILGQKGKVGAQIAGIPRVLGPDGTMEASVINTPNGPAVTLSRDMYFDASELLDEIRTIVRVELREALKEYLKDA